MKQPANLTRRQKKLWKKLVFGEVVNGQPVVRIKGKLDPTISDEIAELLLLSGYKK